ncbi:MAG: molybdate ABC transporter substrate-binding protein, partial [Pseudomonadota bacterium]
PAHGETLRVAVAANFYPTLENLIVDYEHRGDVQLVSGSSGKLFAQISNGAPFHVFLSADRLRPTRLEQEDLAVANTRFTYALGQLVLWHPNLKTSAVQSALLHEEGGFIAIANPKFAPYGEAAEEILRNMGIWPMIQNRISRGESVAQTYQFVASGQASLGFVAHAQVLAVGATQENYVLFRPNQYHPIEQQGVLVKDTTPARRFIEFLTSPETQSKLSSYGYGVANAGGG